MPAKGHKGRKRSRSKKKEMKFQTASLENHAPEEVLNRVKQSMQHLHNLAEGNYDRGKDHLFSKSVEKVAEVDVDAY